VIRTYLAGLPIQVVCFWISLGGMPEDSVVRNLQATCGPCCVRHN
jgi:hypothetical protein